MNTHTPTKAGLAALLTATALALTACGSDSSSGDDKKIDGAKKATKSASPTASPSDDGLKRPKITLPSDVHNVFEDRKTGDPKKDAVLADNERRINSVDEAITSGDRNRPGLKFYSKEGALLSASEYVQTFIDNGTTFTGATRYYDRKVTFLKDGAAAVTYCSDETKSYNKNRKTQEVRKLPGSPDDYTFYNTRLEKNKSGVWQTSNVISQEGAKQCQP
ncbi:hypothetical protein ABZU86_10380 [Streptomyces sp. NPDC005271]|uniref:hypothetical protein n=1 Tax=unclassified Streptomyces TaxID=2593676 RepID=UPI00339E7ED6